jgi:hypothetical protein
MPKDWGGKPNCAPRNERPPAEREFGDEFGEGAADDPICKQCDGTGEQHGRLCDGCGGLGYTDR